MGINVFILEHELKPSAMLSFVIGFAACLSKNVEWLPEAMLSFEC